MVLADLEAVEQLAAAGRHADLVAFVDARPGGLDGVIASPTLALLYGTACARLGKLADGDRWVALALRRSVDRGDRAIEVRALNVRGAIALERGDLERAATHLRNGLAEATRLGDHATVGRCSNNLGIIASVRGDLGDAVGAFTMAQAAFDQAGNRRGVAETHHNLAIAYREQGAMERALEEADHAVDTAREVGDPALVAQSIAGRAEVRVTADPAMARREAERAVELHHELGDVVGESEDMRVQALALAAEGGSDAAEQLLREVMRRARLHGRPLLAATAGRDLGQVLFDAGRTREAVEVARTAREEFFNLGALAEQRKLDRWLASHA